MAAKGALMPLSKLPIVFHAHTPVSKLLIGDVFLTDLFHDFISVGLFGEMGVGFTAV